MAAHHIVDLIVAKRDGRRLTDDEIRWLIDAYTHDGVADEQMAALLMAIVFRGLDARELSTWTTAMIDSGERLDLSSVGAFTVDKHSTGGVGDKASIVIGPIVAACGVPFAKMSGRGLGHTGGTLDKLESIPGFEIELEQDAFLRQVREIGVAIIGQTADLVPADKRLYALRDVTATVDSIPLIASSIMSKKIAAGADAIVLDVKVGDGAFMKSLDRARQLAQAMIELGRQAGREVVCELTDMDQPLGHAVGNALEIREAVETLRGEGPPDLTELTLGACGHLLALSDLGVGEEEGRRRAEEVVSSGRALERYETWIRAQGGDPNVDALPTAPVTRPVPAPAGGYVERIATTAVGVAALHLGAGRAEKDDVIDHGVGVVCRAKRGERVEEGEPLAEVHAADEAGAATAVDEVAASYRITAAAPPHVPIVLEVLR